MSNLAQVEINLIAILILLSLTLEKEEEKKVARLERKVGAEEDLESMKLKRDHLRCISQLEKEGADHVKMRIR
jgi:hypothetical protein